MHQIIPVAATTGDTTQVDTPTHIVAWPPVIGYAELSVLLGRTVGTLQADRIRRPESLPPASTPPGSRTPRWITVDVLDWLRQCRERRVQLAGPVATTSPRRRGRPTKREQIERKRAAQAAEGGV
jgi:hypothetical protein